MSKNKRIIGLVLIVVSVCAMIAWEKWGRQTLMYDEILVINEDTEKGQIITEQMLGTIRVENPIKGSLRAEDYTNILGTETVQFIKRGTPIFDRYFEDPALVAGEDSNEYIMAIPNSWLESYPQTLRRGDKAYFYARGSFITSAVVAFAKDGTNQEVVSKDDDRLAASSTVSLIEVVISDVQAKQLADIAEAGTKLVILYN